MKIRTLELIPNSSSNRKPIKIELRKYTILSRSLVDELDHFQLEITKAVWDLDTAERNYIENTYDKWSLTEVEDYLMGRINDPYFGILCMTYAGYDVQYRGVYFNFSVVDGVSTIEPTGHKGPTVYFEEYYGSGKLIEGFRGMIGGEEQEDVWVYNLGSFDLADGLLASKYLFTVSMFSKYFNRLSEEDREDLLKRYPKIDNNDLSYYFVTEGGEVIDCMSGVGPEREMAKSMEHDEVCVIMNDFFKILDYTTIPPVIT